MKLADFKNSLTATAPPTGLIPELQALWFEARHDWQKAHELVQDLASAEAAWVHAYLHRKEGDLANAGYWYRQARQTPATGSHSDEWDTIVQALLSRR